MTTVSANAVAIASGDFNNDGKLDVALADPVAGTVDIMLGKGNGLFTAGKTVQALNPNSVAAADLNGDGNLDLVTVAYNLNIVNVLLGNGRGGFTPSEILIENASGCLSAAIGDLNGDGKPDIAVACTGGPVILLGNGDGTFVEKGTLSPGEISLAIVDLRGTGINDVVGADAVNQSVDVFLGNGDGTFQAPVENAVYPAPEHLATGYFSSDGKMDVAVTTGTAYSNEYSYVFVLFGNGDGTLALPITMGTFPGWANFVPVAADLNSDGVTDLAVVEGGRSTGGTTDSAGTVVVYISNKNGTFQPGVAYATGYGSIDLAVGDFNGDGHKDLAVLAQSGEGQQNGGAGDAIVLLGNGDGTFQGNRAYGFSTSTTFGGAVSGDFNGDGKPDLVVFGEPSEAYVLLGNGDGTFQNPVGYATGLNYLPGVDLATGDFNGDRHLDLVATGWISNYEPVYSILLGYGDGTFDSLPVVGLPATVSSTRPAVAVADFNKDGKLDLAICGSKGVMILLGAGNGDFGSATVIPTPCQLIFQGNFTNHEKVDLAVIGVGGGIYVLRGNGDGTFQPAIYTPAGTSYVAVSGDFNRDKNLDLALIVGNSVNVFLGNGDGTFKTPPLAFPVGQIPVGLATADLNGDGNLDLVAPDAGLNSVDVLLGNGDGTFAAALPYTIGGALGPFCPDAESCSFTPALADFNGDGAVDIAAPFNAKDAPDSVETMLNTGGTFVNLDSSANPSTAGQAVTFTATVSHSFNVTGQPLPAGSVTFKDGSTVIGKASLISGTASLPVSSLSAGSHSITATYEGNKNYNPHKSSTLTQTVQ
jgi:hypothetical protein